MVDTDKIKATLQRVLRLLNQQIETEITKQSKDDFLAVINEVQQTLRVLENESPRIKPH